ncbi:peptidyl-prolyl cis-trans isomerase-like 3 isoform X3 [Mus musculus]|nr:peptidyl-prolyl cis-trans isomerase-like 3 isoform X3 [Mus musculus]|eukprot:XP_011236898.1 PREDICTED: peptidyl-prolyl cis-trans isomerase-like 3 isoform X2 [Mus musculus]
MVQTGDPTGTGRGGSSIWAKKFEDEYSEYLKHNVRGVVSMANNGPNTNGSQFFITYGKQPHLDMKYTVFGKLLRPTIVQVSVHDDLFQCFVVFSESWKHVVYQRCSLHGQEAKERGKDTVPQFPLRA